jgi:hypothetical protein
MDFYLLEGLLRCPYCGGTFRGTGTDLISNKMEYGVLIAIAAGFPSWRVFPYSRETTQNVVVAGRSGKSFYSVNFHHVFEEDHPEYKRFMPATIELDATILNDLASGKTTPAIEKLIDQFIVLGMPANL